MLYIKAKISHVKLSLVFFVAFVVNIYVKRISVVFFEFKRVDFFALKLTKDKKMKKKRVYSQNRQI